MSAGNLIEVMTVTPNAKAGLDPRTVQAVFAVPAYGRTVARADIGGVMMVFDPDNVPEWLQPILDACDENGDPSDAIRVLDPGEQRYVRDQRTIVEYRKGTAITGAS